MKKRKEKHLNVSESFEEAVGEGSAIVHRWYVVGLVLVYNLLHWTHHTSSASPKHLMYLHTM